jgi:signal transduction histidine kinase
VGARPDHRALRVSAARDLELLAHELRSPVAAIAAIEGALAAGGHDSTQRRALVEVAIRACGDIERLVTDISLFSLRAEPVDLAEVARDVAAATVLREGTVVVLDVDATVPAVAGDPVRLRQAVANLVGNAVGHAPPSSEVVVALARDEQAGTVRLAVTDTGAGLDGDQLAAVFERGTRLTEERPGSGFGLYVVRAVAEAHGGSVDVASVPGRGTTFTLVLPCSPGA